MVDRHRGIQRLFSAVSGQEETSGRLQRLPGLVLPQKMNNLNEGRASDSISRGIICPFFNDTLQETDPCAG